MDLMEGRCWNSESEIRVSLLFDNTLKEKMDSYLHASK